jgi:DNA primase
MATPKEILEIGGREVTISNPQKVYFPDAGYTKLDVVQYYLAVADGALTGVRGRPMALKRFVDGITKEPFFQKRAPDNTPDWIRTAELTFPSGRTADEIVVDETAALAWVVNLGCIDLNPHPVRADDLDHPDELRVDLDPIPGIEWPQIRDVGDDLQGGPRGRWFGRLAQDVRFARDPYQRPHRATLDVPGGPPGGTRPGTGRRGAHARKGDFEVGGRRNASASSSTTTRTPRIGRSHRPTPYDHCQMRASPTPLSWDEVPTCEAEAFTITTVPGTVRKGPTRALGSTKRWARSTHCSSSRSDTKPRAWATRHGHPTMRSKPASRHASSRPASAARIRSTTPGAVRPAGRRQR